MTVNRITLADVRRANPNWFSPENKRFFGDVKYYVLYSGNGEPYLVRSTYAWTDMFGQDRKLHYRINHIEDDLTIGTMLDGQFQTLGDVRGFLATQ